MATRMTDTEKWGKAWFQDLSPRLKCLWVYLCDRCEFYGVWSENYKQASQLIGEPVTAEDFSVLDRRHERVSRTKLFFPGFIEFQYKVGVGPDDQKFNLGGRLLHNGKLDKGCSTHKGVVRNLRAVGINPSPWLPVINNADGFIHTTPPLPTLDEGVIHNGRVTEGLRNPTGLGLGLGLGSGLGQGGPGGVQTLNPAGLTRVSDEDQLLADIAAAARRRDFAAVNVARARLTRYRLEHTLMRAADV